MQRAQALPGIPNDLASTFTDREFRFIADLVFKKSGIVLADHKKSMMFSRLARRVRELKLESFAAYCRHIQTREGEGEIGALINAMTTNLTRFFRENHHFEFLERMILPEFAARQGGETSLRIWSAGCSSGEEPYSIAMTLLGAGTAIRDQNAQILATDLDTNMVARGTAGLYPADAIQALSRRHRESFFTPVPGSPDLYAASDMLRAMITFRPLNLHQEWPMTGPFDAIFCRNVMIYFDNPAKSRLVRRFIDILKPGGWLFVGHAETLAEHHSRLKLVGRTIYQRING